MSENFNGDAYVFLPMIKSAGMVASSEIGDGDFKDFIEEMNDTSKYECSNRVYDAIERCPIGTREIGIRPDIYDDNAPITFVEADILLVIHKGSHLVLTILLFKREIFDVTMLVDNVSTGRLLVKHEGKIESLLKYFVEKYKFETTGKGRTLICTAEKPGEEILSIFAGEMYKSSTLASSTIIDADGNKHPYKLRPEVFKLENTENIALYDWYDCYVSKRTVIYVLPSMREGSFKDSLQYEAAMVFIMELLMLRSNAIESANKQVLSCLSDTQNLNLSAIENLYNSFGETLVLWERENYQYAIVQKLYDTMARRFELDAEEKSFYQKLEQIEHIVELRRSQKNEKDSKDVNKILIALAATQVVLVVTQIILGLIEIIDLPIWAWVSLLLLCLLAMGVVPIFFILGRRKQNG
jgi:hypothetical protein